MKTMKGLIASMAVILGVVVLMSMGVKPQSDWVVPAAYKTKVNPVKGQGDPDGVGKDLYTKHCASCHGKEGYGDGKKAGDLDTPLRDFTEDAVQAQTDGELYYKSFIGRDEMPNFEKDIQDEQDRWFLVNYMRELAE